MSLLPTAIHQEKLISNSNQSTTRGQNLEMESTKYVNAITKAKDNYSCLLLIVSYLKHRKECPVYLNIYKVLMPPHTNIYWPRTIKFYFLINDYAKWKIHIFECSPSSLLPHPPLPPPCGPETNMKCKSRC